MRDYHDAAAIERRLPPADGSKGGAGGVNAKRPDPVRSSPDLASDYVSRFNV